MVFLKKYYGIILVLVLSFWAIKLLFASGFFPMHDDTQVARVFEMGKMLKMGVFPVRWVPDLGYGYGYPIFNFYAPLAYYFGGFFILLGFDALIATKIMMITGILLSGVFMYLLAKEFWGELGGVVSALFYVYAPYHAIDIYVRGDVAEFWAYAFIPLMFLGFYKRSILIGSLGYAGVILSHNLTAMMVTPFLAIVTLLYCCIAYKNKYIHTTYYIILTTVLGLALSAFYWIPALLEMKDTNVLSQIGAGADFRDHFVCLQQLWTSNWGFGGSAKSCIDGMSFMIGKLHIIGSGVTLMLLFALRNKNYKGYKYYILLSFAGFVLTTFLTLEISKPIWEAFPLMSFFQYPWRFLLLASFFSSLLSGFVIWFLQFRTIHLEGVLRPPSRWLLTTVLYLSTAVVVFMVIYFNSKFFQPQSNIQSTAYDYTNEIALKWVASKTSDEYLAPDFKKPKSEKEIAKNPAIQPQETALERVSNTVSLISALGLTAGIILFKTKAKYE